MPTSLFITVAMSGATTTGQRDAIPAQNFPGDFLCIKAAAALARRVFIGVVSSRQVHALPKFSASAIALRIAMDLLTVS